VITATLGGGSGDGLIPAIALILTLALVTHMAGLQRGWDHLRTDYTDEIAPQAIAMGGLVVTLALVAALAIPTTTPTWLTAWIWRDVPLPSGIAAIEAQVQRPRPASVDVGLSRLPTLDLGSSLQQGPDEQPALRVSVDAPLPASPWPRYWRARVLDTYTGRSWATSARIGAPLPALATDIALPGGIAQAVEDLRPFRLTLVGLPDVLAVDVDAQAERLPDGALAALSADHIPEHYRIRSQLQEIATAPIPNAPPPDMGAALRLPAGLPARVRELARTVASDAASPYDKALALERYLRGLPYSYQVASLPAAGDAVDQFLFEMRQGYCTYYASAMAVMARSLGIPARIAVGYATGSYDATGGRYLVREADAHAWPELYIDGRWLPFEPTPVRPLPARGGPASPAPTAIPAPEIAPSPTMLALLLPWLIGGALALVPFVGAWLIWRRRAVPPLGRALLRLERRGARAGVPWPAGATLREYGRLLAPYTPDADQLTDLITHVDAAIYGAHPLSRGQESRIAHGLDALSVKIQKRSRHTH
jgi:transglutaminase-like putative cysteine protease